MCANKLKLNDNKTEVLVIHTKASTHHAAQIKVKIGDCEIVPSTAVRNLGAMMDCHLSMDTQINHVTRSAFF